MESESVKNSAAGTAGGSVRGEMLPDLPEKPESPLRRLFRALASRRYSYLFFCFIIPVVLNYLIYLSMGIHPFGNGSVLVLDLNGQYVYFYESLRNAVYGNGSMIYTFARSLGGEFFGIYAYYLASPFSYIVCLFPQGRMLEALLCIFLLKAGISGVTMGYYLDRVSRRPRRIPVVVFSILYAMSAYAVIQQHNSMWIDALMWFPLLTLGIEELIRHGKFKLFVTMLALTILSNFYIGYMCCIYVAVYFFCFYFSRNEDDRNNPGHEKNHFLRSLCRIALFSAVAVGIAMIIVATAYYSLSFGKNAFSNPDFSLNIRFDLLDFLTKFLPGTYDTIRPEGLPIVYCGTLTLFCLPLYFFSKRFSVREKIFSGVLILFFILSFSVNTLDIIWHGFQKPNWLNYRYSFMLIFFLVNLAYRGFGELRESSPKLLAAVAGFWIFLLAVAQKFNFHSYVDRISGKVEFDRPLETLEIVWLSLVCFIAVGITLFGMMRAKKPKKISIVLCVLISIEAFGSSLVCVNEFGEDVIYSSYSSYNDFVNALRPITEDILENDTGFYRYEKTVHRKYCDNSAFNIRGITNSTSTLNRSTIVFLANLGYAGRSHWSKYLGGNPLSDSLIGIKYVIGTESDTLKLYYDTVEFGSGKVSGKECSTYYNPHALSIAYAVDDDVEKFVMKDSSPMLRLNRLITAMTGSDTEIEAFIPISYEKSTSNCTASSIAGHDKYVPTVSGQDATLTYTFKTLRDGEVFFYLPSEYAREVKVKVNGTSLGNFYASETTRIFSLGVFDKDESVTLSMTLDADVLYVKQKVDTIFQLDTEAVYAALDKLATEQYVIDEGWKNTRFDGCLATSADDRLILTSLTYDKGWQVYVDGERVETSKTLDALVSFRIEKAGEHRVTMIYRPTAMVLGGTVSLISLALFVLIIIFEKKLRVLADRIFAERPAPEHDAPDLDAEYTAYQSWAEYMIYLYPSKKEDDRGNSTDEDTAPPSETEPGGAAEVEKKETE
ncbi:MAG: YfhO family protein [Clostridia bacterium]|nr:YfhO family protein [Clostridia bacterium]